MPVNNLIQLRRGSDWSTNPVLSSGEPGFDIPNNQLKIGDGSTVWSGLTPVNYNLNNYSITGVGNINISGNLTANSGNFSTLQINGTGVSVNGHTHFSSEINDFNESVDDRVSNLLVGISGINISYNDSGNALTVAYTGSAGGGGGGVTINNYADNRILTSDGTDTGINAESKLIFIPHPSGNKLGIGTTNPNGNLSLSNGSFGVDGDSQQTFLTARIATDSNATATLFLDGSSTKIVLPPKSVWNFIIKLNCYSDTNEGAASWNFRGCIKRNSSTTAMVGSLIEENFIDSGLAGAVATVIANTDTNSLDINVNGLNSNNIRWTAALDITQTIYDINNYVYFLPMTYDMVP